MRFRPQIQICGTIGLERKGVIRTRRSREAKTKTRFVEELGREGGRESRAARGQAPAGAEGRGPAIAQELGVVDLVLQGAAQLVQAPGRAQYGQAQEVRMGLGGVEGEEDETIMKGAGGER